LTTTTSQVPGVFPDKEKRQVSEVVLLLGEEIYAVIFVSPDFMRTTFPRLEVRLKFVPEITTPEIVPLL
jgi:hypothetical protein